MSLQVNGFKICNSVYSPGEIKYFRDSIEALYQERPSAFKSIKRKDYPEYFVSSYNLKEIDQGRLLSVLLKSSLIDDIKSELGAERLQFFGDSSIMIGEGERGFHKDNANRTDSLAKDWQEDFDIIRCGLYLQNTSQFSGGLQLRIGSHRMVNRWHGRIFNFEGRAGDIAYWKLTTTHSGNRRIFRFYRRLNLIPRIASLLPSSFFLPYERERFAIFFALAPVGSKYLNEYVSHLDARSDTSGFRKKRYSEIFI
jgi:hypothetical protein